MSENADAAQTPVGSLRDDPRTDEELLRVALTEQDDDLAWHAIGALHLRGSPDTFKAARQLCASADARERRVGADILGQLGTPEPTYHEESVTILLGMLEREQDPAVLNAIAIALGHRKDPRAIEPLAHLKNYPDEHVRYGVVFGLLAQEDERAINALIELSTDPDSDVRDWATFGLGSMIETDTPAIRAALLARLTDEDFDVRAEAIQGLTARRDERVIEALIALLDVGIFWGDITASDYFRMLGLEAAEELADPRLLPALVRLRQEWGGHSEAGAEDSLYDILEAAIKACQPAQEG